MAACNINDLLANAKCFYGLQPAVLNVLATQLWCDISGAITPVPPVPDGSWWNPDVNAPIDNPDTATPIVNPDV